MNKVILLLLIPIFFSIWWINTPQEMYITYASCGYSFDGCYCGYDYRPITFDFMFVKEYKLCSVSDELR